jgi:hypothetical protein
MTVEKIPCAPHWESLTTVEEKIPCAPGWESNDRREEKIPCAPFLGLPADNTVTIPTELLRSVIINCRKESFPTVRRKQRVNKIHEEKPVLSSALNCNNTPDYSRKSSVDEDRQEGASTYRAEMGLGFQRYGTARAVRN